MDGWMDGALGCRTNNRRGQGGRTRAPIRLLCPDNDGEIKLRDKIFPASALGLPDSSNYAEPDEASKKAA